jgi:DNA-directed RNA polymerase subunit RPC12/RpoP
MESPPEGTTNAFRCPRCGGILLVDSGTDELVCFECSRRFGMDGLAQHRDLEPPARRNERIGGMRF